MISILTELARGNINPNDRHFRQNSEFGRISHNYSYAINALYETLDDHQKNLYQVLETAKYEFESIDRADQFIYGFRLGLLIGLEAGGVSDKYVVNGQ